MLSRRKLFGFLAAAPVVGASVAKAAMQPAEFKPIPFEIGTDAEGRAFATLPTGARLQVSDVSALNANMGNITTGTLARD